MSEWLTCDTNTHQHHVIAHVVDASVLGYFIADEAAHMALDIGFIWTIYLDAEMSLLPASMAVAELSLPEEEKRLLAREHARLDTGADERDFSRISPARAACRIVEVELYARGEERRLVVRGEESSLVVETSPATREIRVRPSEEEI